MYYLCNKTYHMFAHLDHTDSLDEYSDVLHGTDIIGAF